MPSPKKAIDLVKTIAENMRKAQINATKMLGLPPDNTPMDRARAMGMEDVYHGSPVPEKIIQDNAFKIGGEGADVKNGLALGRGVYTTTGKGEASSYARDGAVFPLMINRSKHLDIYNPNAQDLSKLSKFAGEQMLPSDRANMAIPKSKKVFSDVKEAREFFDNQFKDWQQFSGNARQQPKPVKNPDGTYSVEYVNFNGEVPITNGNDVSNLFNRVGYDNIKDMGYTGQTFKSSAGNTWDVTNTPSMLRSRFAAFDPARINENDLLAGVIAAPLGLLDINYTDK